MKRWIWWIWMAAVPRVSTAQTVLSWPQARAMFEAANPALRAGQIAIDESRAAEITAFLRPNPGASLSLDQLQPFTVNPYQPLTGAFPMIGLNYLHERDQKRELRRESAQQATAIAESQQADLARTLLFSLRGAFVAALQAKAVLSLATDNLAYFDREIAIDRDRFQAGDIARVDLTRLELQRVQYESDYETARVNLRTAKIQLLQLLNDREPVDGVDIAGSFEFSAQLQPLAEYRGQAASARPDLQAALQAIEKARTDHKLAVANGSIDPVFTFDAGHNPPYEAYVGVGVQIPLRLFDRNQGEKLRTELDIGHAERVEETTQAQVFGDVDSAYVTLESALALLRPYSEKYLGMAREARDTTEYSYLHGQAALVDYLDAQRDYRATYLAYLNLMGACLTAGAQLNLAVGREVIP